MKRYLLFCRDPDSLDGGLLDLVSDFDSLADAKISAAEEAKQIAYEARFHIARYSDLEIVLVCERAWDDIGPLDWVNYTLWKKR